MISTQRVYRLVHIILGRYKKKTNLNVNSYTHTPLHKTLLKKIGFQVLKRPRVCCVVIEIVKRLAALDDFFRQFSLKFLDKIDLHPLQCIEEQTGDFVK